MSSPILNGSLEPGQQRGLSGGKVGVLAGWKRGTWLDNLVPATTFLTAMPYFWLALLLVYLLTQVLSLLPSSGGYDPLQAFMALFEDRAVEKTAKKGRP